MAGSVTVKVEGLAELGERMRTLATKVSTRISVSATGAAAKVIKTRAVQNIVSNDSKNTSAVDTGSLRDSVIIKKIPKGQTNLTSEHIVTVRGRGKPYNKKGQKINRAPHAHLIEFGTVNMPAESFMRPAFDNGAGEAKDVMIDRLEKGIERAGK